MLKRIQEIYSYREMIVSLVRKDLRGRYKGSVLGFLWTFINPLFQIIIYTMVFSVIMKSGIDRFYLYLIVGLIPWIFFSSSVNGGAVSIINQQDIVKKIYFPREVLPISYVTSSFVNMLFCFVIIFAVLFVTGVGINPLAILCLPLVMCVEYILALGIALISAALTVYFRDLEHILGIVTMAWMYLTPIMYSVDMVPKNIIPIFNLNPLTPVIIAYRDILYYKRIPHLDTLFQATVFGIVILLIGSITFSHLQKNFVEEL
ncbi:ABC transporter permease [Anaeromicropila herbilytica]|uniref:Transport permease protein n=1 Tax=Anaeromicropila herbilytica TaxID=2785025 RepID=A0A7R7ENP3_9FIRM|nr:ABC transporter permease [Anaeromicropila herbilytica]BCN32220.1 transport permease protein [Anaeromicropila herbilytica]